MLNQKIKTSKSAKECVGDDNAASDSANSGDHILNFSWNNMFEIGVISNGVSGNNRWSELASKVIGKLNDYESGLGDKFDFSTHDNIIVIQATVAGNLDIFDYQLTYRLNEDPNSWYHSSQIDNS